MDNTIRFVDYCGTNVPTKKCDHPQKLFQFSDCNNDADWLSEQNSVQCIESPTKLNVTYVLANVGDNKSLTSNNNILASGSSLPRNYKTEDENELEISVNSYIMVSDTNSDKATTQESVHEEENTIDHERKPIDPDAENDMIKNDIGHDNAAFVDTDDDKNTKENEAFQRKSVRWSQRVRFSESPEIIPEFNERTQSHSTLSHQEHHLNGFLPHGKEAYPLVLDKGKQENERCSKTVICVVCLIAGLLVSMGVIVTLVAIFYTRGDPCKTSLENQAAFYIDELGLLPSTKGLFTTSYSRLLHKHTNLTVIQYVAQRGDKLPWIRPTNPVQILWNKGASVQIVSLSGTGEYNITYLGDPVEDPEFIMSQILLPDLWYAGRLPGGSPYVLLTVISEGFMRKSDQSKLIEEMYKNNSAIFQLIMDFK